MEPYCYNYLSISYAIILLSRGIKWLMYSLSNLGRCLGRCFVFTAYPSILPHCLPLVLLHIGILLDVSCLRGYKGASYYYKVPLGLKTMLRLT